MANSGNAPKPATPTLSRTCPRPHLTSSLPSPSYRCLVLFASFSHGIRLAPPTTRLGLRPLASRWPPPAVLRPRARPASSSLLLLAAADVHVMAATSAPCWPPPTSQEHRLPSHRLCCLWSSCGACAGPGRQWGYQASIHGGGELSRDPWRWGRSPGSVTLGSRGDGGVVPSRGESTVGAV